MDLITQDSYEKRHKQSKIPSALAKEKEIKEEPIQKIQPRNYRKKLKQQRKTTTVDSADYKIGHHHINARQKRLNATIATKWDTLREYAAVKPITTKENKKLTTWKKHTPKRKKANQGKYNRSHISTPDENDNYGIKLKINGKYQNFSIDTGSPVTIMPNNPELYNQKDIKPLTEIYQDVNKNEIKFLGKVWADIEYDGKTTKLPILITKKYDITPLPGVNWLKRLPITINKIQLDEQTNQPEAIYTKFNKLFETNHTIKNIEVKIQKQPGCYPIQQKARPISYHLQKDKRRKK